MADRIFSDILTIATAIIGLALVAVIVGQHSNTSNVITAAGKAFASDITAAVSPVSSASSIS